MIIIARQHLLILGIVSLLVTRFINLTIFNLHDIIIIINHLDNINFHTIILILLLLLLSLQLLLILVLLLILFWLVYKYVQPILVCIYLPVIIPIVIMQLIHINLISIFISLIESDIILILLIPFITIIIINPCLINPIYFQFYISIYIHISINSFISVNFIDSWPLDVLHIIISFLFSIFHLLQFIF